MNADDLIRLLQLNPHPEGGWYRESFRDESRLVARPDGKPQEHFSWPTLPRAHSTAIYFLLKKGEVSRWHRVDAAEVWHYYCGAALQLTIDKQAHVLGLAIERGEMPQIVVPPHTWQMAQSLGDYTLVGCTVAPGFEFAGFELAERDFEP